MDKLMLIRYDTERDDPAEMAGFFECLVDVHRRHEIPVTLFCKGRSIDAREAEFRDLYQEVAKDSIFDIQDHSYSHIGLGYEAGKPVDLLRADYERSFAAHERVFSKRPIGLSICGTGGADGARLKGFDETAKARAELDMVAELGVRMINSHLMDVGESLEFCNYAGLGYPQIMGFPSGFGDTGWMHRREHGDPMEYILAHIRQRGERGQHMPVMLHDWVAWSHGPDKALGHVARIAEAGRAAGYRLVTHLDCLQDTSLWATEEG
jgi:peptidoglycan/xylan/chitin deacetylase (PgdA/CDA1 family)